MPPIFDEFAAGLDLRGGRAAPSSTLLAASLDREAIRSVVRAHTDEIRACYDAGLTRDPNLKGRLALRWTVKHGEIEEVELIDVTLADPCVVVCVIDEVATWSFPRLRAAEELKISYPFLFWGEGATSEESAMASER